MKISNCSLIVAALIVSMVSAQGGNGGNHQHGGGGGGGGNHPHQGGGGGNHQGGGGGGGNHQWDSGNHQGGGGGGNHQGGGGGGNHQGGGGHNHDGGDNHHGSGGGGGGNDAEAAKQNAALGNIPQPEAAQPLLSQARFQEGGGDVAEPTEEAAEPEDAPAQSEENAAESEPVEQQQTEETAEEAAAPPAVEEEMTPATEPATAPADPEPAGGEENQFSAPETNPVVLPSEGASSFNFSMVSETVGATFSALTAQGAALYAQIPNASYALYEKIPNTTGMIQNGVQGLEQLYISDCEVNEKPHGQYGAFFQPCNFEFRSQKADAKDIDICSNANSELLKSTTPERWFFNFTGHLEDKDWQDLLQERTPDTSEILLWPDQCVGAIPRCYDVTDQSIQDALHNIFLIEGYPEQTTHVSVDCRNDAVEISKVLYSLAEGVEQSSTTIGAWVITITVVIFILSCCCWMCCCRVCCCRKPKPIIKYRALPSGDEEEEDAEYGRSSSGRGKRGRGRV